MTSTSSLSLKIAQLRLQKELTEWQVNPPPGFKHRVSDNLHRGVIDVSGAPGTLYANETYQLQVDFPENYPMEVPQVIFVPPAPSHPHIYSNGHICLVVILGVNAAKTGLQELSGESRMSIFIAKRILYVNYSTSREKICYHHIYKYGRKRRTYIILGGNPIMFAREIIEDCLLPYLTQEPPDIELEGEPTSQQALSKVKVGASSLALLAKASLMEWDVRLVPKITQDEDLPIEGSTIVKQRLGLQVSAKKYYFNIRKSLVEFDEVLEVLAALVGGMSILVGNLTAEQLTKAI